MITCFSGDDVYIWEVRDKSVELSVHKCGPTSKTISIVKANEFF